MAEHRSLTPSPQRFDAADGGWPHIATRTSSCDPQQPAGFLVARFERVEDVKFGGQPDRKRRERLAHGHRVEPQVDRRQLPTAMAGPEGDRVQVRRGRGEIRIATAERRQQTCV